MRHAVTGLLVTTLLTLPLAAQAQFAKVEDAVKYRKATFTVMAAHMGRIAAVAKGERPYDKAAVEADAAVIETMSKLPWAAFATGSDTPDSKAKPEIWKEQDKFRAAADKLQSETARLSSAAKSGDLNAIKVAFGAVGQSCKACHDNYREK